MSGTFVIINLCNLYSTYRTLGEFLIWTVYFKNYSYYYYKCKLFYIKQVALKHLWGSRPRLSKFLRYGSEKKLLYKTGVIASSISSGGRNSGGGISNWKITDSRD